jgi:hypothetical protein
LRAYPASPSSAQQHKQGDLALQARNRCQGQLHFQGEPISPKLTAFLDSAGNEQWTQDLYSALKAFFEAQLPCMKEFIDRLPKPERRHSSHWSSRRAPKGLLPEGAAAGGGSQAGAGEANLAVLGQHEDLPVVVRVERPVVARFLTGVAHHGVDVLQHRVVVIERDPIVPRRSEACRRTLTPAVRTMIADVEAIGRWRWSRACVAGIPPAALGSAVEASSLLAGDGPHRRQLHQAEPDADPDRERPVEDLA